MRFSSTCVGRNPLPSTRWIPVNSGSLKRVFYDAFTLAGRRRARVENLTGFVEASPARRRLISETFSRRCLRISIFPGKKRWTYLSRVEESENPLVHGQLPYHAPPTTEEQASERMFYGQSRIAGAFNMILLRLFGYEGSYLTSVIEGTRSTITRNRPT